MAGGYVDEMAPGPPSIPLAIPLLIIGTSPECPPAAANLCSAQDAPK